MFTQHIFPSTSLRQDFATLEQARTFISRTSPATWAILVSADGVIWVTPEQHGLALEKAGFQILASSSRVETAFKSWLKQLKAAIIKADARFTSVHFADRGFRAYAFVNFFHNGFTVNESAALYINQ